MNDNPINQPRHTYADPRFPFGRPDDPPARAVDGPSTPVSLLKAAVAELAMIRELLEAQQRRQRKRARAAGEG